MAPHEGREDQPLPRMTGLAEATAIDRLTRWAAGAVSRRTFMKRTAVLGAAVLSIQLFEVLPAAAASGCNACWGPCAIAPGSSENSYCCSQNGQVCSTSLICTYSSDWWTNGTHFQARTQICDDGSRSFDCPTGCY